MTIAGLWVAALGLLMPFLGVFLWFAAEGERFGFRESFVARIAAKTVSLALVAEGYFLAWKQIEPIGFFNLPFMVPFFATLCSIYAIGAVLCAILCWGNPKKLIFWEIVYPVIFWDYFLLLYFLFLALARTVAPLWGN